MLRRLLPIAVLAGAALLAPSPAAAVVSCLYDAGSELPRGYGGADDIFGFDGADRLFGLAGIDELTGGDGFDYLDGGADGDTIFAIDSNRDQVDGNTATDTCNVDAIDDMVNCP